MHGGPIPRTVFSLREIGTPSTAEKVNKSHLLVKLPATCVSKVAASTLSIFPTHKRRERQSEKGIEKRGKGVLFSIPSVYLK